MTQAKFEQNRASLFEGLARGDQYGGPLTMARILYDSLEANQGLDQEDIAARYLAWWRTDAFDTGPVFDAVFQKIDEGIPYAKAAQDVHEEINGATAGCNPAHRIAPLALFDFVSIQDLGKLARTEARITHWHPIAGDMAALMAYLCRFLLDGYTWDDAKLMTQSMEPEAWKALKQASVSTDGYAPNVMRTAVEFLDQPDSLKSAKEFAGIGNYCPVIVGALDALRNQCVTTNNRHLQSSK